MLARTVFDAVQAGDYEVLADETSVQLKAGLSAPLEAFYPQLSASKSWPIGAVVLPCGITAPIDDCVKITQ